MYHFEGDVIALFGSEPEASYEKSQEKEKNDKISDDAQQKNTLVPYWCKGLFHHLCPV
jgi:hypothetical protein